MTKKHELLHALIASVILHWIFVVILNNYDANLFRQMPTNKDSVEIEVLNHGAFKTIPLPNDYLSSKPKKPTVMGQHKQSVKDESVANKYGMTRNKIINKPKWKKEILENTDSDYLKIKPGSIVNPISQELKSQIQNRFDNIKKSNLTVLNSDFGLYASFYSRIVPNIYYHWVDGVHDYINNAAMYELMRLNKKHWPTKIDITLDKLGYIKKTIIVHSSGSKQLDDAVTQGIKKSAPFLNPPEGLIDSAGDIHLLFGFNVELEPKVFAKKKRQNHR